MISKKNSSANLEKKRTIFFQIGFIVACAFTLVAFEWATVYKDVEIIAHKEDKDFLPDEIIYEPATKKEITSTKKEEKELVDPTQVEAGNEVKEETKEEELKETDESSENNENFDVSFADSMKIAGPDEKGPVLPIDPITDFPEKNPTFPGGENKMYEDIYSRIKYPFAAKHNQVEGVVYVRFVVNKDGSIVDVEAVNKKIGYGLEREAIRVIKSMPTWEPGEVGGKKVRSRFVIPIKFTIRKN